MAQAIIFGAGKIARGFLGHLMFASGVDFAFVEASEALAGALSQQGQYLVRVLGAPEKNARVTGYRAHSIHQREEIAREMRDARVLFTAVGGKNLAGLAPDIAFALSCARGRALNVVTCENWKRPAALLQREIARIAPELSAGFAESVVMRSAIEPSAEELLEDPLSVNVQDFWRLPVDEAALVAPLPAISGVEPLRDFNGFLERKFYTYNAANGTVSYLGALLGHRSLAGAAWDERVARVLETVYRETGEALSRKHGIPLQEQLAFAATSRAKLRDRVIVDSIERNARDPLRKLGPDDRLVGSARLAMEYGVKPEGLSTAIAAALHYHSPGDPSAEALGEQMRCEGAGRVLEQVCRLPADGALYRLVLEKEAELRAKGWLK